MSIFMKRMWNQDDTVSLIQDLHRFPCLWDMQIPEFKNKALKVDCINTIAAKFGVTPVDIEKKIHCLKGQFRREHKKLMEVSESGQTKAPWFAYSHLLFLLPGIEMRGSRSTDFDVTDIMEIGDEESTNDGTEDQNFESDDPFFKMPEVSYGEAPEESSFRVPEESSFKGPEEPSFRVPEGAENKKRKRKEVEDIEKYMSEACKYMQFIAKKPQKDMCSQFADLVATKLRSLDEDTRDLLMNEIDNLIFKVKQRMRGKKPQVPSGGAIYSINHSVINFPNFHPMSMDVAPDFSDYNSPQTESDHLNSPEDTTQETSEDNVASTAAPNNFEAPVNGFQHSVPGSNSLSTKSFNTHLTPSQSKETSKDPLQPHQSLTHLKTSSAKPPLLKQKPKDPVSPSAATFKSQPVTKQRNISEPIQPQPPGMSSTQNSATENPGGSHTQSFSPHQFFPPNYFPVPQGWPPYSHPFPTNASPFPWQPTPHPNQFQINSPHSVSSSGSMQSNDLRNEKATYNAS